MADTQKVQETQDVSAVEYLCMAHEIIQKAPAGNAGLIWAMLRDYVGLSTKHKELVSRFCRCVRDGEEVRKE